MTFGFMMIKVSFNVSNNLCQAQAAHAGRKRGCAVTLLDFFNWLI